jgi:hypothetical protein
MVVRAPLARQKALIAFAFVGGSPQVERRAGDVEVPRRSTRVADLLGVLQDLLLAMNLSFYMGHFDLSRTCRLSCGYPSG